MAERIYLDHAATTPMLAEAMAAVEAGMRHWANPSSPHAEGRAARAALEKARAEVAAAYGWAHELVFTGGASESLHMALTRSMAERRLISAVEHDSVLRHSEGAQVLPVDGNGVLRLDALEAALAQGPRALVGVQRTNSETGVIQPIEAIAGIVHAAGGILLVDAAQMPVRASAAVLRHADLVAVSAHKRGGPPGIGALLVRDFGTLLPMGGQEKGYRAGTENLPGALGYAAAVSVPEDLERMAALRARLEAAILAEGGEVVGAATSRSPLIGAYRMPGVSSAAQLIRFDMAGISVSAGSACSSGSMRPSHVLSAMGWEEPALREVVRVSFGRGTTEAEVDAFTTLWRQIAIEARTRAA
ncbi:aminotransferase class V-fold PLP-dependent enzyme [Sphingomonas sp. NIBR02145]|uniref:cysteine desulfurase family protein n=1 Tax=Sphingomonas sp. NIBR02145 TaxID=3014784 RepID=UPI0022B5C9B7|nr:aminotransferase class V-fold PLP-dependent enzyme [Sphingomonas sp. NIBR02145]WHU03338.1 aminotransferase class V-fold PLP-dependent enzyme [Sphingomonas sp. NIBR02145]